MALIKPEDIAQVKERTSIEDVVREHVTLRSAGPGSLKGLCPFHDEKTPSFTVRPAVGAYHCFGCGEGGDVIRFVQEVDHLSFVEAVERLAARAGVELRYEDGEAPQREPAGKRQRTPSAGPTRVADDGPRADPGAALERVDDLAGCGPGIFPLVMSLLAQRSAATRTLIARPVPGSRGVADPRRHRRHRRLRRAAHLRRRPDRGQVPQHVRDADLQEDLRALRPGPGQARAGGDRRGLHRRDGLPPRRGRAGGRDLRHVLRRRPHQDAAADPARRGGTVSGQGHLHLRR